ncbi:MAG: ELWxxDGT repeat protein [Cyclobacteriaceae bacterium]
MNYSIRVSLSILLVTYCPLALSQASLVKDINTLPAGSFGREFAIVGDYLFFGTSNELWKTDGTTEGTELVKVGNRLKSLMPENFQSINGILYFSAYDIYHGQEIWRSDGTESGTYMIADITTGPISSNISTCVCDDKIFFWVNRKELWTTNGTIAGTTLIKSFNNPSGYAYHQYHGCLNNLLVFNSETDDGNDGLWITDGTPTGTDLISMSGTAEYFTNYDDNLYFIRGSSLYKIQGTDYTITKVPNNSPSFSIAINPYPTVFNGELYFVGNAGSGVELLKTDGTELGTTIVKDIEPGTGSSTPFGLTVSGDYLYFVATTTTHGQELWRTDGTEAGTILIKDLVSGPTGYYFVVPGGFPEHPYISPVNGGVIYSATDGESGYEWWFSNGAQNSLELMKDISPGDGKSIYRYPANLPIYKDEVYFYADDGEHGVELYKTNGTSEGTILVKDITVGNSGSGIIRLMKANNSLYFVANDQIHGEELWKSDGTPEGTFLIKDIRPDNLSSGISRVYEFDDKIVFRANSNEFGSELWISDGTTDGTNMVIDLNPGIQSGILSPQVVNDGFIYFSGTNGTTGYELWKSDGTSNGTLLVKDINGSGNSSPKAITEFNGKLILSAFDGIDEAFWISDGTELGTTKIKSIGSNNIFFPGSRFNPLAFSKGIFFVFDDVSTGLEIGTSDGTADGTFILKDINEGPEDSSPADLIEIGDYVFFSADDGIHGRELWKTDGTTDGTQMVKDIVPGSGGSIYYDLTMAHWNDRLVFVADDGVNGLQLWESDGTADGTKRLLEIEGGANTSSPYFLISSGENLFFSALHNGEFKAWQWNSNMDEPVLLGGLNPSNYVIIGGNVYFLSDDPESGREVWKASVIIPDPDPDLVTSIDESQEKSIVIYPNPVQDKFTISSAEPLDGIAHIHNSIGSLVKSFSLKHSSELIINISDLPSGLYFFSLSTSNSIDFRVRIIKY